MATYQNDFKVKNSLVVRNTATISTIDNIQTISYDIASQPTINLNFLNGSLDTRITFSRASGATYVGSNGIVQYASVNQPRFDYSPSSTGTIRGLLIEEQRTNLIPYSQDQTQWAMNAAPNNYLPTANAAIAPDGTASATFILKPVASGNSTIYKTWAGSTSTNYIGSIWLKAGGYSRAAVVFTNSAFANIDTGVTVNLSTGAIISVLNSSTVSLTSYTNSWYRISITAVSSSTTGNYVFAFYPLDNSNNAVFAGDGVSGIYSWGAQVETSQYGTTWPENFVTSYIPTLASQVTRSGDDAKIAGQAITGVWNQNNGTLFAEWMEGIQGSTSVLNGNIGVAGFTNPAATGYNGYAIQVNTNNSGSNTVGNLGRNQSNYSVVSSWPYIGTYISAGQIYKSVIAWDANLTYGMTDGVVPPGTSGAIATNNNSVVYNNYLQPCNTLLIGNQNSGGIPDYHLNGWVRRIQWWPSTLSAARIQALTTSTSFPDRDFASSSIVKTGVATTANFVVKQGVVVGNNFEAPDIDKFYITNLTKPTQQASLNLNFLRGVLDPRISFTRASGATVVGPDGFIKYVGNNVPRFNYSTTSTGTCLGLLIEEQRTNLALYSGQMIPSLWSYGVNSTYIGTAIAPDGSSTAASVTANGSGGNEYVARSITYSSSTVYTASVWARLESGTVPASGTILTISYSNTSTTTTSVRSVINYNGNLTSNWQRFSTTFTNVLGGTYTAFFIADQTNTSTIQAWGAQIEQGNFVTSYIPTGSATATRASDLATMSGQNFMSWINPTQGTLYLEADAASVVTETPVSYRWPVSISTGFGQKIGFHKPGNSIVAKIADDSYVSRFEPSLGTITTNTTFKVALSYSSGNQFAAFNYVNSATGTATVLPKLIDNLRIGNGDAAWCGHIRRVVYYPEQLASTVTQSLTVI
jgi:hypothetical protein